ncbi:hypothetical protein A9Z42_0018220 [Trichoderma parareesei]|uniref:Protein kinase domain-containing protein n=1 Tax=Trichoderma parareesei TaxID=858221 RepID=A0A2H2ZN55_TRIPA|nr:hypothetical protein A9Z42_0018220 [Trichoderma parareesei]
MGDSTAIISFEDIFFRCVNNPDGGEPNPKECSFFLPQNEADSLVVEDKVAATLVKLLDMSTEDAEKSADYVVKFAKKVFLTLLYTDTIEFIDELQTAGFKDEHLPVCYTQNPSGAPTGHEVCSLRPELPSTSRVPLEGFANWGLRKIAEFSQKQWIFLCPVFDDTEFIYQFSKEQRLPFMPAVNHGEGAGHFGLVQRLKLHPAHYRTGSSSIRSTDRGDDGPIEVALKYLLQDGRPAEREKFYKREMDTLQMMNKLNNRHLIKAIATYKKGSQMYFLFPWADGGNLEDLFQKGQGRLDETQAKWAFTQMIGLSAGISELNSSKFRHGDIKPSNILCFGNGAGTFNDCRLVIADVGLAKFHAEYTRNRNKSTTTRHGSMTYEPPEVFPKTGRAILSTKRYDTWSLGCVFLEFLIWLLYGGNGLKAFYEDLNKDPNNCRFWKDSFWLGQQHRHPAVSRWIKRLKADLRHPSAFRDLVATIKKSMLVRIDGRKSSKDLHQELLKIQDKVSDDPKYLYSSDLERLASRREPASGGTVDQGIIKNLSIQLSSGKPVSYVLDEPSHVFRNVFDDRALISIYSDPGWRPQYMVFQR